MQSGELGAHDLSLRKQFFESDGEQYMRALLFVWHNPYAYASLVEHGVKKATSIDNFSKPLRFKGYGNPVGPYWFMGIEERGSAKGLSARGRFNEIEDLAHAHGKDLLNVPMTTHSPTWATMSRIVLRLEGERDWKKKERARRYQAERLGRSTGETFLCDLLPLPAKSTGDWQYEEFYPDGGKEQYLREVLPARREMLGELFRKHRPRYVVCYGKEKWAEFARLFDVEFRSAVEDSVKVATIGNSTVVLTRFFRYLLGDDRPD